MAPVDMESMRQGYEEQQRSGGDYLTFENGETLCYVHPPCRSNDKWQPTKGRGYVPVTVHFSVGKNKKMVVSLDPDSNPILEHPFLKKLLKKKKIKLTGKCPVAKALKKGKAFTDDEADESRAQTKYLWGLTPLGFKPERKKKKALKWQEHELQGQPSVAFVGKQIYDGIMEAFFDNDCDISDPTSAILVRIIKTTTGKGKRQVKYVVKPDPATQKKPMKIDKALKKAIAEAMKEGGECDLFRVAANMVKGPDEVTAILKGVEVDEDPDEHDDEIEDDEDEIDDDEDEVEDDEDEIDDDETDEDDEVEDDEDEIEDDDDEVGEDEIEDDEVEDDEDEVEDDEDTDDDETDEDDEVEDDEDEIEDDDDEVEDDEDDLGLNDIEDEIEDLDDDEDEPPKPKGKSAKGKKGKDKPKKKAAKKTVTKKKGVEKKSSKKGKGAKKETAKKKPTKKAAKSKAKSTKKKGKSKK